MDIINTLRDENSTIKERPKNALKNFTLPPLNKTARLRQGLYYSKNFSQDTDLHAYRNILKEMKIRKKKRARPLPPSRNGAKIILKPLEPRDTINLDQTEDSLTKRPKSVTSEPKHAPQEKKRTLERKRKFRNNRSNPLKKVGIPAQIPIIESTKDIGPNTIDEIDEQKLDEAELEDTNLLPPDISFDVKEKLEDAELVPTENSSEIKNKLEETELVSTEISSEINDKLEEADLVPTEVSSEINDKLEEADLVPTEVSSDVNDKLVETELLPPDIGSINEDSLETDSLNEAVSSEINDERCIEEGSLKEHSNDETENNEYHQAEALKLLKSEVEDERLEGAIIARKALSVVNNPPINDYIQVGIIPYLINCLESSNDALVMEGAWALTNLASGTKENTLEVIDAGAADHFVRLLKSNNADIVDQCVWGIGNILGEGEEMKSKVFDAGAVNGILQLIDNDFDQKKSSHQENLSWALSNCYRGGYSQMSKEEYQTSLKKLHILLGVNGITDTYWCLHYVTAHGTPSQVDDFLAENFLPIIMEKLHDTKTPKSELSPLFKTLGNIISGTDEQADAVIMAGVLPVIYQLLKQENFQSLRKEALWVLSNIMAGTPEQVSLAIQEGFLEEIHYFIENNIHSPPEIMQEVIWTICNLPMTARSDDVNLAVMSEIPKFLANFLFQHPTLQLPALKALLKYLEKTNLKEACKSMIFNDQHDEEFFIEHFSSSEEELKKAVEDLIKASTLTIVNEEDEETLVNESAEGEQEENLAVEESS